MQCEGAELPSHASFLSVCFAVAVSGSPKQKQPAYILAQTPFIVHVITNTCGQAETNGGGLALWGSDGSLGKIRTGDETYHQAWLPWITKIGRIIAANQITEGGVCFLPP